jgi:hypothetical protein
MLVTTSAAATVPTAASADANGTSPTASIARVAVGWRHLNVRAGRRAIVRGRALPSRPGVRAMLQVRRGSHWHTLDHDRTGVHGRYHLHRRVQRPMSARARVVLRDSGARAKRRVGRLNVYRTTYASWYGPGLYGNHLACGGRLGYSTLGVANKSLPCGAKVTLRYRGRTVRVPVVDRGPYAGNREFDLTPATKARLGFGSTGTVWTTR